jgi:transcriptional regulator with GAF, ATPase, and Fis domain
MALFTQAKVLRALQNQEIQSVGANRPTRVDLRFIAATHKNLSEEVKAGRFREDLFFRINLVPVVTVPLRDRQEDISLLAEFFLRQVILHNNLRTKSFDPEAFEVFKGYAWPGNVRELQNLNERLAIMSDEILL